MATYSDDFSSGTSGWSETDSGAALWDTLSDQLRARGQGTGTPHAILRYDSDLDGTSHFSEVDVASVTASTLWGGPSVNISSAANTAYCTLYRESSSLTRIDEVVAGSTTTLASNTTSGTAPPSTLRLTRDGSNLTLNDGSDVLDYEIISGALTGVRAGVNVRNFSGTVLLDNWSAEDIAGAGGPAVSPYGMQSLRQIAQPIAASRLNGVMQ